MSSQDTSELSTSGGPDSDSERELDELIEAFNAYEDSLDPLTEQVLPRFVSHYLNPSCHCININILYG